MPHAPTVDRWLARLPQDAAWRADGGFVDKLRRLAVASDFAMATLAAQPGLIERLHADDGATPLPLPVLAADQPDEWPRLLRRYRHAVSTVLAWRDIVAGDPVEAIIAGSTALADACLRIALEALEPASPRATAWSATPTARSSGWWCSAWASSAAAS